MNYYTLQSIDNNDTIATITGDDNGFIFKSFMAALDDHYDSRDYIIEVINILRDEPRVGQFTVITKFKETSPKSTRSPFNMEFILFPTIIY